MELRLGRSTEAFMQRSEKLSDDGLRTPALGTSTMKMTPEQKWVGSAIRRRQKRGRKTSLREGARSPREKGPAAKRLPRKSIDRYPRQRCSRRNSATTSIGASRSARAIDRPGAGW